VVKVLLALLVRDFWHSRGSGWVTTKSWRSDLSTTPTRYRAVVT